MIPAADVSPGTPAVWVPLAILSAFCTLLLLAGTDVTHALSFDRTAIANGEWWRLITDNFVHLGGWHLFLNLLSLVLLAFLCPEILSPLEWARRLLLLGLGMSLGLYFFSPRLDTYVGLSGMIYGLFALGIGRQVLGGDKIAIVALLFLAARIAWELFVGAPASEERLVGGRIVGESHLWGVASALIYGAAGVAIARFRKLHPQTIGGA